MNQQHDDELNISPFESIMNKWWGWRNETLLYTYCGKRVVEFGDNCYAVRPKFRMGYIDFEYPSFRWRRSSVYFSCCLKSLGYIEKRFGVVQKKRKLLGIF